MSQTAIIPPGQPGENLFKRSAQELVKRLPQFEKIETADQFTAAGILFRDLAGAIKRTTAHYDPKIADARVPYTNLLNEKKSILDILDASKRQLDGRMTQYENDQKRLAKEKSEQEEKDRLEEAQISEAERLHGEGKPDEAMEVLGGTRETAATVAATSAPVSVVKPDIPKVAGVHGRERWKARLKGNTDEERAASFLELCKAVAEGKVAPMAIEANWSFLNNQGNTYRKLLDIPGVEAYPETSHASRG